MNDHGPVHGPEHVDNGPRHPDWRKDERQSNDYRDHEYVVDNWHERGLRKPPRGYISGWRRRGLSAGRGDVGIIAQVILSQ